MSHKITHVPIITGESYLLLKFIEDCEKFGYKGINKTEKSRKFLTLNGNAWKQILESDDSFKSLWLHRGSGFYSSLKKELLPIEFNIDTHYHEALKFMEENMLKWEGKYEQKPIYDIF